MLMISMVNQSFIVSPAQIWRGSEPSVTHLVSEGSPLQDDAVSGLCPSRHTLIPSAIAMSAVPPFGGTASYAPFIYVANLDQSIATITPKGMTC